MVLKQGSQVNRPVTDRPTDLSSCILLTYFLSSFPGLLEVLSIGLTLAGPSFEAFPRAFTGNLAVLVYNGSSLSSF